MWLFLSCHSVCTIDQYLLTCVTAEVFLTLVDLCPIYYYPARMPALLFNKTRMHIKLLNKHACLTNSEFQYVCLLIHEFTGPHRFLLYPHLVSLFHLSDWNGY